MKTLVFLEHHDGSIQRGQLGVLSSARQLGLDVRGVLIGSGVRGLAEQAGRFGAQTVFVAEDSRIEAPLPQPRVDVIARLVEEQAFENVLFAQSVLGADIAAALAARLDAGLNWDLAGLEVRDGGLVGIRSALADTVRAEVTWKGTPRIALIRSGAFEPVETGGSAQVEDAPVELRDFSTAARMVDQAHAEQTGPSIEDADVIVSGGRGLGSAEGFRLVEQLAQALGGAVGASRAAVDAGWYPYETQVGQTGKKVSPKLYIAVGISGAIQHKVGMQNAGTVIAINKDGHAPIFEFSDLGVVGDLNQIVPKLTDLIRARRSG